MSFYGEKQKANLQACYPINYEVTFFHIYFLYIFSDKDKIVSKNATRSLNDWIKIVTG